MAVDSLSRLRSGRVFHPEAMDTTLSSDPKAMDVDAPLPSEGMLLRSGTRVVPMVTSRRSPESAFITQVVSTQNQVNISLINRVTKASYAILLEDPIINLGASMELPPEWDISELTHLDEAALHKWSEEHLINGHQLMITVVDYTAQRVFRSNAYEVFMCDLNATDRESIEAALAQAIPFTDAEILSFTEGQWWRFIDKQVAKADPEEPKKAYDAICYRALKTFQAGGISIDEVGAILNYCGAKIEFPDAEILEGDASKEVLLDSLGYITKEIPLVDLRDEDGVNRFFANLPMKYKMGIRLQESISGYPNALVLPTTLNQFAFATFKSDTCLVRPVGASDGHSHRNRFASSIDRPFSIYVPGVKPPDFIHRFKCDGSAQNSIHDQFHHFIENLCSRAERLGWINFAQYIFEITRDEAFYEILLDRLFFKDFNSAIDEVISIYEQLPLTNKVSSIDKFCRSTREWWAKEKNQRLFNSSQLILALPAIDDRIKRVEEAIERLKIHGGDQFTNLRATDSALFEQLVTLELDFEGHRLLAKTGLTSLISIENTGGRRDKIINHAEAVTRLLEAGVSLEQLLTLADEDLAMVLRNEYDFNRLIEAGLEFERVLFLFKAKPALIKKPYEIIGALEWGITLEQLLAFTDEELTIVLGNRYSFEPLLEEGLEFERVLSLFKERPDLIKKSYEIAEALGRGITLKQLFDLNDEDLTIVLKNSYKIDRLIGKRVISRADIQYLDSAQLTQALANTR